MTCPFWGVVVGLLLAFIALIGVKTSVAFISARVGEGVGNGRSAHSSQSLSRWLGGNGRSTHNSQCLARGGVGTAVLPTVHQV